MRLLINIPKEFEQHFQADRFEESLHRLSADAHLLAGNYEQETVMMLIKAFETAILVPPHGLIDKEQILDSINLELAMANAVNDMEDYDSWVRVFDYVRKFPTIIEAEVSE